MFLNRLRCELGAEAGNGRTEPGKTDGGLWEAGSSPALRLVRESTHRFEMFIPLSVVSKVLKFSAQF